MSDVETIAAACTGVVKVYAGSAGEVTALKGVDVEIRDAAVTALVGPSGSGKSSLLRILAGFDRPTAGSVRIGGVETNGMRPSELRALRRRTIGYVFQRPADNLVSYLSVRELLHEAARMGGAVNGWSARADELLALVHLEHRATHRPSELSGGEQQRASFAAVLMHRPSLVVADEPTGELDSASARDLWGVWRRRPLRGRRSSSPRTTRSSSRPRAGRTTCATARSRPRPATNADCPSSTRPAASSSPPTGAACSPTAAPTSSRARTT